MYLAIITSRINAIADIEQWQSDNLFELLCFITRYAQTGNYNVEVKRI